MSLATRLGASLALAAAATLAAAAPSPSAIAYGSGSPFPKPDIKLVLTSLCSNAGGQLTEFSGSSSNISTYVCSTSGSLTQASYVSSPSSAFRAFAGTSYAELRVNVSGGSFAALCLLAAAVLPGNQAPSTTVSTWPAGACESINGSVSIPSLGIFAVADRYRDPATGTELFAPRGANLIGGLMDIPPDAWPAVTVASLHPPTAAPQLGNSGWAPTFGVAVTDTLYNALYAAQRASGVIPAACPVTPTMAAYAILACVPTIGSAQMAAIMANNEFNPAYVNGVGFLVGAAFSGVTLEYNRIRDTADAQAAAQVYFLGLPCSPTPLSIVDSPPVGSNVTIGAIKVYAHASTGDVRARLSQAGVYGIAVIAGENNQSVAGTAWKWIRVNGSSLGENAQPGTPGITNRASVTQGLYDFYYESKYAAGPSAAAQGFWSVVTAGVNAIWTARVGWLGTTDLRSYCRNCNVCQPSGPC